MGGAVIPVPGDPLIVLVPVLVVWLTVVVDIALQPRMPGSRKALWAVACTLFWPMLLVYWLTRPMPGLLERHLQRTDAGAQLVDAALAHEAGRLDDGQFAAVIRRLRGR